MAQYSNLEAYIEEKIYENGTQAITGDILQDVLKVMTDDLGEFYQMGGVASPSTDPGTPDAKVIYFATEAGTYTNFGGITIAAGEVALLIFETSWTKVELNVLSAANGGVKTANLADGAVTTEKIAGGAVETAKIANNAVTSGKVADGAIGTAKIADGAIGADKIAANAVETAKIKNGAVTEGKINDGAVTAGKVAANAVTTAKIADDAVTTAKLNDGAVTEDKIATDAVTSGKVKDGAIGTAKIAAGAVTHAKIGAGAVEESNIKDGAVTSDKIADGAVGSDQLAEGAFSAENLADGSVTTDKLADEAVTAEKLADGAVTADKFANGSVTTIKLGSGAVTTEKIGDGMVTRQKLADSSVSTSKIIDGAVTTDKVADGAITDAKLENPVSVSQNIETGKTELLIGDIPALIVDNEPEAGSDNLVKSGGVKSTTVARIQNSKTFYITDSLGHIVAKTDKDGVHSVDFIIGENATSVSNALANVPLQIFEAVNAEKVLRKYADAAEEERAKAVEATKLNAVLADDAFYFTDSNNYIIAKIDATGVHSVNIDETPNVINGDNLLITDSNGYIIARVDSNGVHSAQSKHSVACMVLSENYYPITAPIRDNDGNVTHVEVMFATGVTGEINITYTQGLSSSVEVIYGDYTYTITINRDSDGNVTTVSVN